MSVYWYAPDFGAYIRYSQIIYFNLIYPLFCLHVIKLDSLFLKNKIWINENVSSREATQIETYSDTKLSLALALLAYLTRYYKNLRV